GGSYYWAVPNTPSTNCKIRITDVSNSALTDESDNVFTIISTNPTLTVTTPNGGESWGVGTSRNIYWNYYSVANVKLEYSTDNGSSWSTIIASTPCDGHYSWVVPNTPSSSCLIRVSD